MNESSSPETWGEWARREALSLGFIARTVIAMLLALLVALKLDLSSPGSAAVTVSIVSLRQKGMVLEKAVYRFLGTVFGAVVTVTLVGLLSQHEFAFLGAVALWIGLCTAISAWFRTFRAYAWVLCGYTTCLIGFPAFLEPRQAFDIAVDRVTIVTLGIMSATVIAMVFSEDSSTHLLDRLVERVMRDCMMLYKAVRGGETDERIRRGQLRFAVDLGELEQARTSGVIEDPITGLKSPRIVALTRRLTLALGRMQLLHRLRTASTPREATAARIRVLSQQIMERELDNVIAEVETDHASIGNVQPDLAEFFVYSRAGMTADPVQAVFSGLRAALVFALGALFWIQTGWSGGALATVFATVLCCVLAAQPDVIWAAWQMCLGVLVGIPAALICGSFVLPAASGAPMLVLGLLPFLVLGAWLMALPGRALRGSGYFMSVVPALSLTQVMVYDTSELVNTLIATLGGVLLALVGLAVVGPADPDWRARSIRRHLLDSVTLAREGRGERLRVRFDNRVRELTAQLMALHSRSGLSVRDELLAIGVLAVGASIIRLRRIAGSSAWTSELDACLDEVVRVVGSEDDVGYAALDVRLEALQERLYPPPPSGAPRSAAPDAALLPVMTGVDLLRVALDGMVVALATKPTEKADAA